MKITLLLALCVFLAACSTTPLSSQDASPVPPERLHSFQDADAGSSRLVVTRDKGLFGSGCRTNTYINGVHAAEVGAGESARFYLKPGRHIVGVQPRGICTGGLKEAEVMTEKNKESRYRISIDSSSSMDISPTAF
ncbi:hypothetical protein [Vreelandella glaciei]|uniref:hypothetical protein n=1 Tax=Vreelandella glaciei TaxID=186761 RepID=UPI003002D895